MKEPAELAHSSPVAPGPAAAGAAHAPAKAGAGDEPLVQIWASQRVVHLFLKLTIYYTVMSTVLSTAMKMARQLEGYLPIGGALALLGNVSKDPFQAIEISASQISSLTG